MSGAVKYHVNMADLVNIADGASELDGLKQFYVDQPDKMAELGARAAQLHAIVERAAGAHAVVIYAPDDGAQYLDYDRVKAFFADKLSVVVYPVDKWVLMMMAAIGAQNIRNLGDVKWCATEDGSAGKGTGRHIAAFILEGR